MRATCVCALHDIVIHRSATKNAGRTINFTLRGTTKHTYIGLSNTANDILARLAARRVLTDREKKRKKKRKKNVPCEIHVRLHEQHIWTRFFGANHHDTFFLSFVLSFLLPGVKPAASVAYRPASRDPVSADVVRWYPEWRKLVKMLYILNVSEAPFA